MMVEFCARLEEAQTLADIFEVVKAAVMKSTGQSRAGLMLGMANLGNHPQGFFGGFFTVGTNVIVMNKIPLHRIKETRPELYKPYAFHVLLHEYIHSLGYLDEGMVRSRVLQITRDSFGIEHLATQIASRPLDFMKHLVYPDAAWRPDDTRIELERDFDRSSVSYIG
ncbi:MAG: hypothetical protein HPY61_00210 [Methanotrichaceae archaeon]|nr:hypothetical protein [Methanotrichaceae archaeon]